MYLKNHKTILAWLFFGLITVSVAASIVLERSTRSAGENPPRAEMVNFLIPIAFAFVGALIISRQPRNVIGLLLMLPGLSLFVLVDAYLRPFVLGLSPIPQSPTPLFLAILWFSNWNWLLLVLPLMFIMVLFPTGRPLNKRWGWLIYYGLALAGLIVLLATLGQPLAPGSGSADWSVPNPIGFLTPEWVNSYILPIFVVALPVWVILCAAALFVRFRRARPVERNQIKWLLFAVVLFTVSYIPTFLVGSFSEPESIWNILWVLGMLTIPVAIAIAILRYQLFDIDLIIQKTAVYTILSALLALVYFGSIILLQTIFEAVTQERSPFIIVVSTLLIAALFNPLRQRVQAFIDRRFFRQKYDARLVLAQFAQTARDEVSLEALTAELACVVEETMQPDHLSIWTPTWKKR